jgi:Fur family ferric uptake transcriptional regulator
VHQPIDIEALCAERGLRITDQRRVIAQVLSESDDHPDVEKLHERAVARDPRISIATVYRTVRSRKRAFSTAMTSATVAPVTRRRPKPTTTTSSTLNPARSSNSWTPNSKPFSARSPKLGYRLVDHRMELYGVKLDREA